MRTLSNMAAAACLLALASPASAVAPQVFLADVPALPADNCKASKEQQDAFRERVRALEVRLQQESRRRKRSADSSLKANRPQVEATMAQRAGLTPEQAERLKQTRAQERGASREEKQRLREEKMRMASQAMQGGMGGSPSDVQAADPSASPPAAGRAQDGRALMHLNQQSTELARKVAAPHERAAEQLKELEADPEGLRMLAEMRKKHAELTSMMGVDYGQGPRMDALSAEIRTLETRYCARLGPRQLEILRRYRAEVDAAMPDYARRDEVQAALFQAQTGTASPAEPGETAVTSLHSYVDALGHVFQYDVRAEKN
jgi:hypothetical protein